MTGKINQRVGTAVAFGFPMVLALTLAVGLMHPQPHSGSSYINPSVGPPARVTHVMAFDPSTSKVLLFGGNASAVWDAHRAWLGDTWTFDGNWSQESPAQSPGARGEAAAATDPIAGGVLLFGGLTTDGTFPYSTDRLLGDTWLWKGSAWSQIPTQHSPPPRAGASLAYDPQGKAMVLLGGGGETGILTDTWTFNGTDWSQSLQPGPTPPEGSILTLDTTVATGELVALGSCDPAGRASSTAGQAVSLPSPYVYLNGVWSQTGRPVPPAIGGLCGEAQAYDSNRNQVIVFGGTLGQPDSIFTGPGDQPLATTQAFVAGSWHNLPGAVPPPGRDYGAAAFDPVLSQTVLFGGDGGVVSPVLGDTWTLSGTYWIEVK